MLRTTKMGTEECRVCGADAAGRHYGSVCCSGCKGFFRRSVRFQKLYRCPYDQKCSISKMYRNCCRACRFQKCQYIGLDPKLVQGDWGQSNAAKKLGPTVKSEIGQEFGREVDQFGQKCATKLIKTEPFEEENGEEIVRMTTNGVRREEMVRKMEKLGEKFGGRQPTSATGSGLLWQNCALNAPNTLRMALGASSCLSSPQPGGIRDCQALADFLVSVERYCDYFVDSTSWDPVFGTTVPSVCMDLPVELALRQPRMICPRYPLGWAPRHLEQGGPIFAALFSRLLVHQFDWFSHLPELAELTDEDRRLLLKRRTMRSVWFTCAQRSIPFEGAYPQGLSVTAEVFHPRDPALQSQLDPCIRGLLSEAVSLAYDALIVPMRQHRVSEAESALLRVIALFTPVARLSRAGLALIQSTQNKYLNALSGIVRANCAEGESPIARMGQLLMLLPALEQTASKGDETFSMFHAFCMNGMEGQLNYELHVGGD